MNFYYYNFLLFGTIMQQIGLYWISAANFFVINFFYVYLNIYYIACNSHIIKFTFFDFMDSSFHFHFHSLYILNNLES